MPKVVVTDKKGLVQETGTGGLFIEGGDKAGYIALTSVGGNVWYLFVENDGTLKIHNAAPNLNGDGNVVGEQVD